MNAYGVNIEGLQGIYDPAVFYKRDAPKEERTFTVLGGPGADPKAGAMPGSLFGARTIKVCWADGTVETISSHSIAAIINAQGKETPKPADGLATVEEIAHVVRLEGEAKVFIPVKTAVPAARVETSAYKAEKPAQDAIEKKPGAPRVDRESVVSSPEFIALFEATRNAFKDPSRAACKRGHAICAANAHVGDLRRPPHRYSCDLCLRKVPGPNEQPAVS